GGAPDTGAAPPPRRYLAARSRDPHGDRCTARDDCADRELPPGPARDARRSDGHAAGGLIIGGARRKASRYAHTRTPTSTLRVRWQKELRAEGFARQLLRQPS